MERSSTRLTSTAQYCSIFLSDLSNTKIFEDGFGGHKTPEELQDLRRFQNKWIVQFANKKQFAVYSMIWPTKPEAAEDVWEAEAPWTTEELENMQKQDQSVRLNCMPFHMSMMK
jgi:hypothetical protein